jgi:P pilus assembly chaperone PapD
MNNFMIRLLTINKKSFLGFFFPLLALTVFAQDPKPEITALKDTVAKGVSVSPASMQFNVKPGTSQSKKLKVFNDTDFERNFQVTSQDYNAEDINRAAVDSKTPEDYKYGLTKWIYITPTVFTLKPGEKMEINVLVDVPAGIEFEHSAWSIVVVEEVKTREEINTSSQNSAVGLGIIPTMGFGIFVYQNPPGLKISPVALTGFSLDRNAKKFKLKAENQGQGISFCTYYVELLNVGTGKSINLPPQQATFLPGAKRNFEVAWPELPSGSYNALLVLDFGSKEMVETAEIDFAVP